MEPSVIRISIDDGLSQSSVTNIVQDRDGFLWFGTQDGLNRYDGISFRVYRHQPFDQYSLRSNFIISLAVDSSGMLWVGTDKNLSRYNKYLDRFEHVELPDSQSGSTPQMQISSLHTDLNGTVWIGTLGNGIYYVSLTDSVSTHANKVKFKDTRLNKNISVITTDRDGKLFVTTYDGEIFQCDPYSLKSEQVASLPSYYSSDVQFENEYYRWLYRQQPTQRLQSLNRRGFRFYQRSSGKFVTLTYDPLDEESIGANSVRCAFRDRFGSLWIGTNGAGVSRYDGDVPGAEKFEVIRVNRGATHGLQMNSISGIAEAKDGKVWIGTYGTGLHILNPETRTIHPLVYQVHPLLRTIEQMIRCIIRLRNGDLLIGTYGGSLLRYDSKKKRMSRWKISQRLPWSSSIMSLLEDTKGNIWIGTWGEGVAQYNVRTLRLTMWKHNEHNLLSPAGNTVRTIIQDSSGRIWIGTDKGINVFSEKKNNFISLRLSTADSANIAQNAILTLFECSRRYMWVGTYGSGLIGIKLAGDSVVDIRSYSTQHGLPNNVIYGILEDKGKNLWLSTNLGLTRFSPSKETFRNFDAADGLAGNEFNQASFFQLRNGTMLFGGVNGLTLFHPDSVQENKQVPAVILIGLRILGKSATLDSNVSAQRRFLFSHEQNVITFEFAAFSYILPHKNKFAYMMDGFDRDWISSGVSREATYTNLEPGEYTFRVKASNHDGIWNEVGCSVHVVIMPPYWKTWWFRSGIVFAIAGIIAGFVFYRIRQLLAIERLRMRIASDLHDAIGTGLTEISIMSEVGAKKHRTMKAMSVDLTKIGAATRSLAQNLSDIVWLVNPKFDSLADIILQLKKSYDELLLHAGITFKTSSVKDVESVRFTIEQRKNIYLLLKEAINNSIKHSRCSVIELMITLHDGTIKISVRDDGKGMQPKFTNVGNGLGFMSERAKAIGASFDISSENGKGTTIEFTLSS
ncbi:MAG: hypothetical protein JRZ94_06190 [Nitrososphaerota archaeon]|nr:hypothetical protein [Nitrososphaerota archaeon]